MGTRPGTLLEENLGKIFTLAGFKTSHQARVNGYEIDVLAETEGIKIAIECKQYEKAPIDVRNLIHQWDSKNKEIQAHKILLAIYGIEINQDKKDLSEKYGITLWDKKDIEHYLDYTIEHKQEAKHYILNHLRIGTATGNSHFDFSSNPIGSCIQATIEGIQNIWGLLKWLGNLAMFLTYGAYYLYLCLKEQWQKITQQKK